MTDAASPHEDSDAGRALREARRGVLFAALAYTIWGTTAAFFQLLGHVRAVEVIAHRALWSIPIALVVLLVLGRTGDMARAFRSPRLLAMLAVTATLVSVNWGFYVWAVTSGRGVEASLGYFINPLVNVALGYVLLGERLGGGQKTAVGLAVLAVLILTISAGVFPWISLVLAITFGLYGYFRKTLDIGPAQGFLVEVVLLAAPSLVIAGWLGLRGEGAFLATWQDTVLLIASGLFTAMPLIFFAAAARRLRLATLGLMQYIAPSLIFLTAVLWIGEPMGLWRWISFAIIWLALGIFSLASLREQRRPLQVRA